ncbi:MAG: mechanosensitive ion channel family protein [Bacillota bacterium]
MILNRIVYGEVTVLNIIVAVLIFAGAVLLSKLFSMNIRRSLKERVAREHLELIVKVSSYIIIIIAVLWALPHIGVEPSGLMVAGGIVGLAIGFASQRIVGNLISGLFLIIERPVKIGDIVDIDGVAGFVEDIRVISTTIRTYDGLYVRIPNETVFTAKITNFVSYVVRRFEYRVGIRYSDDAEKAIRIILNVIEKHPLALINPPPQAFVDELGDSSVNIIVRVWAPTTEWYTVKMDLLWKIKCALEDEGIEIPLPQRVLWYAESR